MNAHACCPQVITTPSSPKCGLCTRYIYIRRSVNEDGKTKEIPISSCIQMNLNLHSIDQTEKSVMRKTPSMYWQCLAIRTVPYLCPLSLVLSLASVSSQNPWATPEMSHEDEQSRTPIEEDESLSVQDDLNVQNPGRWKFLVFKAAISNEYNASF